MATHKNLGSVNRNIKLSFSLPTTRCGLLGCLLLAFVCSGLTPRSIFAAPATTGAKVLKNLPYKTGDTLTPYERERCFLDLYLPKGSPGFATLVWFHGGGLTAGRKDDTNTTRIAKSLAATGLAVAAVNYRLSPKATYPAYVEDAAAAVAWVYGHITQHGGNTNLVFVGGHSAGGYLTAMLGMDIRYLQKYDLPADALAGLIPVSGQLMTHYTIRAERGIGKYNIIADEAAPIFYCRKDTPPMLVLYADKDMASRLEENQYFTAVLRASGNKSVTEQLITEHDHSGIGNRLSEPDDQGRAALLEFIAAQTKIRVANH